MQGRISGRGISKRSECFDQKVAALFHVETTEEKKERLPAEFRKIPVEILARAFQIHRGRGGAVIHHHFVATVERERFARQTPFLLRSEKDGGRVAQHPI